MGVDSESKMVNRYEIPMKSREIERLKIMYCINWEFLITFIDYF